MTTSGLYRDRLFTPYTGEPPTDPSSPRWSASVVGLTDAKGHDRGWGVSVLYQSVQSPRRRVLHITRRGFPHDSGDQFLSLCNLSLNTSRAHPFTDDDLLEPGWIVCAKCDSYRVRS